MQSLHQLNINEIKQSIEVHLFNDFTPALHFAAHTVLGLYLRCIDLRISTETHSAYKRAELVQIYLLRQYSLSSAVSSSHSRQHPT